MTAASIRRQLIMAKELVGVENADTLIELLSLLDETEHDCIVKVEPEGLIDWTIIDAVLR